jgi:hypothetical protein
MARRNVLPVLVLAGALAGCQGLNHNPQPGPHVSLDTLRPTADFYERVDQPLVQSSGSLAGLSRDNWSATSFYVPVTGVEHKPTYTTELPRRTSSTPPQRGEYPTQLTAAQNPDDESTDQQALEALLGPLRAGWDVLWFVPKMIATPPDSTVSSPRVAYQRAPRTNPRTNGGLKSSGLGVALLPLTPGVPPPPTTPAGEASAPVEPGTPVLVAPPAPPPASDTPIRLPGGAIGGADSHKRRNQQNPPPPPASPPSPSPDEPAPEPAPEKPASGESGQ